MPPRTLANDGGSLASWRFPGAPTWLMPAATSQPEAAGHQPAPQGMLFYVQHGADRGRLPVGLSPIPEQLKNPHSQGTNSQDSG